MSKTTWREILGYSIFITIFLFIGIFMITEKEEIIEEVVIEETIPNDSIFLSFKDSLYNYLKQVNVQHLDIVMAQAILESGNFSSKLFNEYNNLFGMTVARQRPTLAQFIESSVYAAYNNWQESVIDYAFWQTKYSHNLTRDEYFDKLKVYAQDHQYISKLKLITNESKNIN